MWVSNVSVNSTYPLFGWCLRNRVGSLVVRATFISRHLPSHGDSLMFGPILVRYDFRVIFSEGDIHVSECVPCHMNLFDLSLYLTVQGETIPTSNVCDTSDDFLRFSLSVALSYPSTRLELAEKEVRTEHFGDFAHRQRNEQNPRLRNHTTSKGSMLIPSFLSFVRGLDILAYDSPP